MTLEQYLLAKSQLIEEQLDRLIPEGSLHAPQLFQAVRYSLLGGGKRLRPILTLATCEALGGNEEAALHPACALEMIHTYSMIHDDLPCMDDDDFRRGKPSLHKAFSEAQAVLSGDYLLTYAFETVGLSPYLSPQQIAELVLVLAKKSGGEGMITGQVMDIEACNQPLTIDSLNTIHRYKTGALIAAAVEFGAIIAGATEEIRRTLHLFATDIGLSFQIVDDILDVTASSLKHGHASDASNGKTTYVTLLGIEESKKRSEALLESALDRLTPLSLHTHRLAEIAERLVRRQK